VPVEKSVVGPEGQITIPKALRDRYHLLEGEEVVLVAREEGVPMKHRPSSLRGRLRGKLGTADLERDVEKTREEWRV
jgi:AbrB family looped-hinge helix DNA binding protein